MTPALFLWISLLFFILDSSLGFAVGQEGIFRITSPAQNLQDDDDFTLTHDESEGQSMYNKESDSVYSNFNMPQAVPPPYFVLAGQNVPNTIWQPSAQYPAVDSKPQGSPSSNAIVWSVETNDIEMPTFQYPPVNAESGSAGLFVQGNDIWQPSIHYPPVNVKPAGSAAVWSVQDNEVGQPTIQYPPVNVKPAGSAAVWSVQGNEVGQPTIQYPPVNVKPEGLLVDSNDLASSTTYGSPSKPSLKRPAGDWPLSRKWLDFVFSKSFGDEDFDVDVQPQNSVMVDKSWFAEEPTSPQSPKSFIVRSKNGYKRGRVVHTKTFYSTDYEKPKISMAAAQKIEDNAKNDLP